MRLPTGLLGGVGAEHSQSLEALCMHVPGLKVVLPSTPADAKGLLKTAIRDPNPVIFFEHKGLSPTNPTPETFCAVNDEATGMMVDRALAAADQLALEGHEIEVIDPRTLVPLDMATILDSVQRTGRAMIVQEAVTTAGAGAEISSRIHEEMFFALEAPVWRLGAIDTPIPQDPELEQLCIPQVEGIAMAMRELIAL